MKRFLCILFSLLALPVPAQTPTPYQAAVESNGCILDIWVSNLSTAPTNDLNTNFNFGFTGNALIGGSATFQFTWPNIPVNPTVNLSLTTSGFSSTGGTITYPANIPATHPMRTAFPAYTNYAMTSDGSGGMIISCWLAQPVFNFDTGLTVSIAAGWYSNNAAVTGLSVANNSTRGDPLPFCAWMDVPWQRISGSTMTSKAFGYAQSATNFMPLACLVFTYKDQHSHTVADYQTQMQVDWTTPDPTHGGEYIDTVAMSSFTSGDIITRGITAYPQRGTNKADAFNPLPSVILNTNCMWYMPTASYTPIIAVVDVTNGVDGTGSAVQGPLNTGSPPSPFTTIAAAFTAMKSASLALNSLGSLPDCTLYGRWGLYATADFTSDQGTNNRAWCHFVGYPTDPPYSCILTNTGGTAWKSTIKMHLQNVGIEGSGAGYGFNAVPYIWVDQCDFISGSTATIGHVTTGYATWNRIEAAYAGLLFGQYSSENDPWPLVRGNTCLADNYTTDPLCYCFVFNYGPMVPGLATGTTIPSTDPGIIYNNMGMALSASGAHWFIDANVVSNGILVLQNVVENTNKNLVIAALSIAADLTTTACTNAVIACNTIIGQRVNLLYNDEAGANPYRVNCQVVGNLCDDLNTKSDVSLGGNASWTNNWSDFNGVNWNANFNTKIFAADFIGDFDGINGYYLIVSSATNYLAFIDAEANGNQGASTNGYGNYRLTSQSPALALKCNTSDLPFDIEGNLRGMWDPPGAYSGGNPRRGDFVAFQ